MRATRRVFLALGILAVVSSAPSSRAACNAIPDAKEQLVGGVKSNAEAVALAAAVLAEERQASGTPYKGALGRIDRVYLSPLRKDPLRVAVDGQCIGGEPRPPLVIADTASLVAAAIFLDADGAPRAQLATGDVPWCDTLQVKDERSLTVEHCAKGRIGYDAGSPRVLSLAFERHPSPARARRARIVAFRASSPEAARATLGRLATTSCRQLCAAGDVPDLGVCVDTLYAPVGLVAGQIQYAPDMVKCEAMEVPTEVPLNDFGKLCDDGPGVTGVPACQHPGGPPEPLALWEDSCHGVYIPFDWTSIRHASTGEVVDRVVRGKSAASRREEVEGGRIWVPGREFVGTLTDADLVSGGVFVSDPRKAAIDVWYDTREELGLQGVIDKDKSIIHVVPRLATSFLCDDRTASGASDEACMRVATQPALDVTRCACTDRYPADCTCTSFDKGRFFQCSGSKMPCTRHDHCNPTETCSGRPQCQKEGAVWDPMQPPGPAGALCWTDQDCTSDAAHPQCGYLLFNAGKKHQTGSSVVKLDKTIASAGPKKQRGACKLTTGSLRKACSNGMGGPPACSAADGDCVGWMLEAMGKK